MKISVVTVCYNSILTMENTIISVLDQSYSDLEYIVVDGNSNDGTKELVEKYKSKIDVFISEPDCGLYDAMNKGIGLATGDLVGILNSDDVFAESTVLETIVKFHQEHIIDASISDIVQINNCGKVIRSYSSKNWRPESLKIGLMPAHPAIFFRRNLFAQYGMYHLDFKIGADYELITRFFLKHRISFKYLNLTTTSMRVGGVSSSGLSSYLLISKEIKKALVNNNISFNNLHIQLRFFLKLSGYLINNRT